MTACDIYTTTTIQHTQYTAIRTVACDARQNAGILTRTVTAVANVWNVKISKSSSTAIAMLLCLLIPGPVVVSRPSSFVQLQCGVKRDWRGCKQLYKDTGNGRCDA